MSEPDSLTTAVTVTRRIAGRSELDYERDRSASGPPTCITREEALGNAKAAGCDYITRRRLYELTGHNAETADELPHMLIHTGRQPDPTDQEPAVPAVRSEGK